MNEVFKSINDVDYEDVKWIDTRFSLQDSKAGRNKFEEGHIKGALYWDLEQDLSDMSKQRAGRHPLPDKETLTALFQNSGLELHDRILIYDDGGSPFAARAWWILQYGGFKNSVILRKVILSLWQRESQYQMMQVSLNDPMSPLSGMKQFLLPVNSSKRRWKGLNGNVLLDARSAERYRGEVEPIDPIAGHIPGALNFDWERLKIRWCLQLV